MLEQNIRQRILIPLVLVVTGLILLGLISFHRYTHDRLNQQMDHKINTVSDLLQEKLNSDAELMYGLIDFIAVNPCLQKAYLLHQRKQLQQCSEEIFLKLKKKYRITHFYFS